jgi:hypothetical protein
MWRSGVTPATPGAVHSGFPSAGRLGRPEPGLGVALHQANCYVLFATPFIPVGISVARTRVVRLQTEAAGAREEFPGHLPPGPPPRSVNGLHRRHRWTAPAQPRRRPWPPPAWGPGPPLRAGRSRPAGLRLREIPGRLAPLTLRSGVPATLGREGSPVLNRTALRGSSSRTPRAPADHPGCTRSSNDPGNPQHRSRDCDVAPRGPVRVLVTDPGVERQRCAPARYPGRVPLALGRRRGLPVRGPPLRRSGELRGAADAADP